MLKFALLMLNISFNFSCNIKKEFLLGSILVNIGNITLMQKYIHPLEIRVYILLVFSTVFFIYISRSVTLCFRVLLFA